MPAPTRLVKTLLYALLEQQATSGSIPRYHHNTTLNHKYNNQPAIDPPSKPILGYFGIGINGFKNLDDKNYAAPHEPYYRNMDIFEPIPFRLVPVENDITSEERALYRMRVRESHGGYDFWAYYLKAIQYASDAVRVIETVEETGQETEITEFDSAFLSPVPTRTTAEDATIETTRQSVVKDGIITLTGDEVREVINVLKDGDLLYARISELGFYSGVDVQVAADDGQGGSITVTESLYTQLAFQYTSTGSDYSEAGKVSNMKIRSSSAEAFLL